MERFPAPFSVESFSGVCYTLAMAWNGTGWNGNWNASGNEVFFTGTVFLGPLYFACKSLLDKLRINLKPS